MPVPVAIRTCPPEVELDAPALIEIIPPVFDAEAGAFVIPPSKTIWPPCPVFVVPVDAPASKVTTPPAPVSPSPTDKLIYPPLPPAAVPVLTLMDPESPPPLFCVDKVMSPELAPLLVVSPEKIVRKNESLWKTKFSKMNLKEDELIDILSNNPALIERPIIEYKNSGVLARPIENLIAFHEKVGELNN